MINSRDRFICAIAGISLVLTGCASGAPAPSDGGTSAATATRTAEPTATPTPVPVPDTVAARILVTGSTVSVLNEAGDVLQDVPFSTDGATAAALLSAAIGVEPALSTAFYCNDDTGTQYDWGSFQIVSPAIYAEPSVLYSIIVAAPATSNGLTLEAAPHVVVGDTIAELLAAAPGTLDTWATEHGMWLVDPTPDGQYGLRVQESLSGDTVLYFSSPIRYGLSRGC